MMYSCSEKAEELATKLAEKGYDEELVTAANELANKIGEYEEENPMDLPVVKTQEDEKYGHKDEMPDGYMKDGHKDYSDMDEKDMRKSMKKSGIILIAE